MDDVYNEAVLHPGVTAYPTALALADMAEVSGKDFISAVVAGYDVIGRLGRALKGAEHYARGLSPHRHLRDLRGRRSVRPAAGP